MYKNLLPEEEKALEWLKLSSKEKPITGAELSNLIGLKNEERGMTGIEIRELVHSLRVKNFPICSTSSNKNPGYFWAGGKEDIDKCIKSLHGRAMKLVEAEDGLRGSYPMINSKNIDIKTEIKRPIQPFIPYPGERATPEEFEAASAMIRKTLSGVK